ncbi:hypothetical protein BB561_003396 [Smittium simulii]|uniref:Uncharacterized protein n=1 Tax=Smittium simulii TaxID=133385 RepID=A0A2T9YLS7_9FUNG|nr:hypothetical protein BB561_003396 [Smittium simulii]
MIRGKYAPALVVSAVGIMISTYTLKPYFQEQQRAQLEQLKNDTQSDTVPKGNNSPSNTNNSPSNTVHKGNDNSRHSTQRKQQLTTQS